MKLLEGTPKPTRKLNTIHKISIFHSFQGQREFNSSYKNKRHLSNTSTHTLKDNASTQYYTSVYVFIANKHVYFVYLSISQIKQVFTVMKK